MGSCLRSLCLVSRSMPAVPALATGIDLQPVGWQTLAAAELVAMSPWNT